MGYNFFNIKEVPDAFNCKLNEFRASLGAAVGKGKNITFADNDITYTLKLQHDRISRKGLELDYDIYSRDDGKNKFIAGSNWRDAHYESTVCFNQSGIKRKVKIGGKTKYSDDHKSVLYETITDVVTGSHPDNDPFCCPNCGAVSTVAGLQNGCPHCGTRFQIDDLFPKVTSYYFLDSPGMTKKEFMSGYLVSYAITLIAMFILCLILHKSIGFYIGFAIGSIFIAYILYAYFLLMKLIVGAISSAGKMGTAGSRSKFEKRMKKISPEFSYEYFTSKTLSLIKTAVFSEDESELLFYEGEKLDPKMKDIIDLNYGGALGCKSIREEGHFVTVETKAYFDVLYASGDKVFFKKQVFSAVLKRRTDIPVNFNFSMTKISCPSCCASFDATKNRNCPYCGNKYEITTDDWALAELKYI
ncbi:MAG: hypothetical protein IKW96_09000 [Ruminococcus sp.]|uniref:hypothetical protein n=1 Tax=Ruminococcus sp. TaxID=41978 RepID=UPI0025D9FF01|nr:hypothetical protein [Ruminococcus sp.]MBR5683391.1 hypothetical protein [Ruminococcus sp.]